MGLRDHWESGDLGAVLVMCNSMILQGVHKVTCEGIISIYVHTYACVPIITVTKRST